MKVSTDELVKNNMRLSPRVRLFAFFSLVPTLIFIVCCSSHHSGLKHKPHEQLRKVIEKVWQAKVLKNREAVYAFLDQKYRKEVTLNEFMSKKSTDIQSFTLLNIDIQAHEAISLVEFKAIKMGYLLKLKTREKWICENGHWHLNLSAMTQEGPFGPTRPHNLTE